MGKNQVVYATALLQHVLRQCGGNAIQIHKEILAKKEFNSCCLVAILEGQPKFRLKPVVPRVHRDLCPQGCETKRKSMVLREYQEKMIESARGVLRSGGKNVKI